MIKQPFQAMLWTVLPYAVWTVWAVALWNDPSANHLGILAGSALLGLPFSLVGALFGWVFRQATDTGLFVALLLGAWVQYALIGWFLGRAIVRRRVLASLSVIEGKGYSE